MREEPAIARTGLSQRPLRPPAWLKRPLLLLWNGGHHLARQAGDYAGSVVRGRFERCTVCGGFGPMIYRRRVIPPRLAELWGLSPALAEAMARKESLDCARCGAKLRVRRLAAALLELFPAGDPPAPSRSVRRWAATPEARALRVAEFNRIDGLHAELARLPNHIYCEYRDGAPSGGTAGGVRSEDLTRLTFADGSLNLVLTSETLEHVPDLDAALGEIRRVLAPGGHHLFTVPFLPGVPRTFARAVLRPDGRVEPLATPIRHPGGDHGWPVFTEFGADLPAILRRAGFDVEVRFGPPSEADLGQVFVTRRR